MGLIRLISSGDYLIFILIVIALVFALCIHEFAHGFIAYKLGDHTALRQGRLTLNPLAHLDPMGSMMILFVGFGWAKPVPVNPVNFSNPREDMIKVAFAGPGSNLLLAFIGGLIMRFINIAGVMQSEILIQTLYFFVFILLRSIALTVSKASSKKSDLSEYSHLITTSFIDPNQA